jgi:hypothetical protein
VAELIRAMAAAGRACRHEGEPLAFPVRILDDTQSGHHLPEASFDSRTLHPDHPVFGETDLAALQAEVAHLRNVVRFHPTQVAYRALSELQRMLRARPSGRR